MLLFIRYYQTIENKNHLYFFIFFIISLVPSIVINFENNIGNYILLLLNYTAGFLTFNFAYNYKNHGFNPRSIFTISFWIVWFLSLITVIDYFTNLYINLPSEITGWEKQIYEIGFAGGRTGWSISLALFIPLAFTPAFQESISKILRFFIVLICVAPLLLSQFFSGGRSGLLASIAAMIYLLDSKKKVAFVFQILIVAFTIYLIFQTPFFLESLRIDVEDIELTTSFRLVQYYYFFDIMNFHSFFAGFGPYGTLGQLKNFGLPFEFHNVLIRSFLDFGLMHGVMVLVLVLFVIKKIFSFNQQQIDYSYKIYFSILLAGLIPIFFEPRFLIGDFQNSILWFLALGIVSKLCELKDGIDIKTEYAAIQRD